MSAPETTSKGRPSLLSETAPGAADNTSRILASLEGRVAAQQAPRRRRSKIPLVAAALAVVGFSAAGAWQWQRSRESEHPLTAAAANTHAAGASAVAAAPALVASGAAVSTHVAQGEQAGAASAPRAAVIVADDSVHADARAASASDEANADPLSRALASDAVPAQPAVSSAQKVVASSTVAAATPASAAKKPAPVKAKSTVARTERESAKSRHEQKTAANAHTSKRTNVKVRAPASKEDPDADLIAVLVARTKPYEPNAAQSASSAAKAAHPAAKTLSDQVKACDKAGFFEAQACRWRVCSDHWGKDPACPSANSTAQTR